MKIDNMKDKIKGWFVGDFERATFRTKDCEVCHKVYKAGDHEQKHMHKVATEVSVVTKGRVRMNGKEYGEGDIIMMEPGEATDFEALTDAENIVVKVPSVMGDKYVVEE